ncbi:hypothetical protein [Qipengyuania sp.]|uniref:hypothetical protein n=1 Tax=Qipengyuania sp. TaxID=2004515 RepID=UPI0035C7E270
MTGELKHPEYSARSASSPVEAFEFRSNERAMAQSSAALAKAMASYGIVAARRREALREASVSRAVAPLPVNHAFSVQGRTTLALVQRSPAPSREPCPRCATRGDLGCAHFAPFVPA